MSPALFYLLLGVALIAAELVVMQFTVFWFLIFGLGALATSIICWAMPEFSWVTSTSFFIGFSVLISLLLYPILKKWQRKPTPIAGNDAIGQTTKVVKDITPEHDGKVSWSGAEWTAQLADGQRSLTTGETAVIKKIRGIHLIVGRR